MRLGPQLGLIPFIGSLVSCAILDPTYSEPAIIISYGDTAQIAAPDSVARGAPFEVSVETFGGGCTRTTARTEIRITGLVAEIRPYNETRRGGACTDDILILTHRTSVQFEQSGVALVRVLAEQRPMPGTGAVPVRPRLSVRLSSDEGAP